MKNWGLVSKHPTNGQVALLRYLQSTEQNHLMDAGKTSETEKILTDTFSITIDEQRYRAYEAAAKAEGMGLKEWLISVVDDAAELDNTLPNPYSDNIASTQNQGTEKQETAKQGLPSHTESSDPATRKRTTEETLGILRIGTNPGAKRKSGSA